MATGNDFDRKVGDRRPLTATLQTVPAGGGAPSAYDLTGYTTLEVEVYLAAGGSPTYYAATVVGSPTLGGVKWAPSADFVSRPGKWSFSFVVDRTLAGQASFPEDGTRLSFEVHAR